MTKQIRPVDPRQFAERDARGAVRKLTDAQVLELTEWVKARRALGSHKTKAAELGICPGSLSNYLIRIRRGDARGRGES